MRWDFGSARTNRVTVLNLQCALRPSSGGCLSIKVWPPKRTVETIVRSAYEGRGIVESYSFANATGDGVALEEHIKVAEHAQKWELRLGVRKCQSRPI